MAYRAPRFDKATKRYHPVEPRIDFWLYDGGLRLEPPDKYRSHIGFDTGSDQYLRDVDTVVLKIGSNILAPKEQRNGAYARQCVAEDVAFLLNERGKRVMIVSSGGMAIGRKLQNRANASFKSTNDDSFKLESAFNDARYGRAMMDYWVEQFSVPPLRLRTHSTYVTNQELRNTQRRARIISAINKRMDAGKVPIINEDDAKVFYRALQEGMTDLRALREKQRKDGNRFFSCNDGLASYMARQLTDHHNVMIMLMTNEWGLRPKQYFEDIEQYKQDNLMEVEPNKWRLANEREAISVVNDMTGIEDEMMRHKSNKGRGGMDTKLKAVVDAVSEGIHVTMVCGMYPMFDSPWQRGDEGSFRTYRPLQAAADGELIGTRFIPKSG